MSKLRLGQGKQERKVPLIGSDRTYTTIKRSLVRGKTLARVLARYDDMGCQVVKEVASSHSRQVVVRLFHLRTQCSQ
jgi:hypothetical protein